jgi:hypothetical protein
MDAIQCLVNQEQFLSVKDPTHNAKAMVMCNNNVQWQTLNPTDLHNHAKEQDHAISCRIRQINQITALKRAQKPYEMQC